MFMQKGPAQPGSVQALDPFNRMPAGWTLTQPPGKWGWDRPPRFVNPDEAVSFIIDKLEEEDVQEQFVRLMFAGISIQEIVKTIAIGGFSQGYFTPDVAEIVKTPIAFYLLGVAAENEIPVKFFATPDGLPVRDRGIEDMQLLRIMKERNPEFAKHLLKTIREQGDMPAAMSEGFMGVSQQLLGSPEEMEYEEEYEEGEEE